MADVKLAFSFDTEGPRRDQIDFVQRLIEFLDRTSVPRTFFLLGQYLEGCLEHVSSHELRRIYNPDNPLNDIQQHSYSHPIFKSGSSRLKPIISPLEFIKDLELASQVLEKVLGVTPIGMRTPYGYPSDLSDVPEVLEWLSNAHYDYVSSHLRAKDGSLRAELTLETQPHTYQKAGIPNLIEVPSQGWQDVVFIKGMADGLLQSYTKEEIERLIKGKPEGERAILDYYTELFDSAQILTKRKKPIYVCLCLHPFAVMEYDPQLNLFGKVIEMVRKKGIEVVSCAQIAREVLV